MTGPRGFDEVAPDYAGLVNSSIAFSGEDVDFFADLKVNLMVRYAGRSRFRDILDFGCGVGLTTRALRSSFPESRVTGYDPSHVSIREAAAATGGTGGGVRFVNGDGPSLPLRDECCDAVFCACVFHHIAGAEHVHWVREICRVLRPGGLFFMFEHNPLNPLTRRAVRSCPFDEGVILLTPRRARRVMLAAGLDVERPRYYFFFPRPLRRLRSLERHLNWLALGAQYYLVGHRRSH
jgi:SAM-dependent methyltransferase